MVSHFNRTFFALFTVFAFNCYVSGSPATTVTLYGLAPSAGETADLPSVSLSALGVNAGGATTYLEVETDTFTINGLASILGSNHASTQTIEVEATIVADATHIVYSYNHTSPTPSALSFIVPVVEDCQIDLANNEGVCVDSEFLPSTTFVTTNSGSLTPIATLAVEIGSESQGGVGSASVTQTSGATPSSSNGARRVAMAGSLTSVVMLLGICLIFRGFFG